MTDKWKCLLIYSVERKSVFIYYDVKETVVYIITGNWYSESKYVCRTCVVWQYNELRDELPLKKTTERYILHLCQYVFVYRYCNH